MSKIVNEPKIKNKFVVKIRELLEHRAFWLYLLVDEAESLGADAVINIRYGSSSVMQGAAEVISYGTAVKYRWERETGCCCMGEVLQKG